jgi:hypothetical protein
MVSKIPYSFQLTEHLSLSIHIASPAGLECSVLLPGV